MQMPDDEDGLPGSVAPQNGSGIRLPRQRAEESLLATRSTLEQKSEELAFSLAMMRATLEASRDGILATDGAGRVTAFNQTYVHMWGLDEAAMASRDHHRILSDISPQVQNPKAFMERIHSIYRTSPTESFDLIRLRDGRVYERASQIQFVNGSNVGRVWIFRDITERLRADEALQEETRVLELLNRTGTALAAKLDVRALLQAVTDAATEISGASFGAFFYNTMEENGKTFMLSTLSGANREAFGNSGQPRATALFGPTFAGAPPVRIDDVLKDPRYGQSAPHHGLPPGHLAVRSYLAVPVASGSGEVIGGLFFGHPQPGVFNERAEKLVVGIAAQAGVAIDNARLYEAAHQAAEERRTLLENERAARGEAEHMSRMKDEFLAMLAHELRNPLAPLRNSVEMLRRGAGTPPELEKIRAIMDRQIAHMTRLVDDLLDVSRISRGKLELRLEEIRLEDALRSATETSRPLLAERKHRFGMVMPDQPLVIAADLVRLSQAFTNLLNNAAKYTPEGGAVDLRVMADDLGVTIHVEDTGMGVPDKLRDRIFEMFVQGEGNPALPDVQGGLGIGLTLVRKIVEMHGGNIRAEGRTDGPGTRFVVWLPLAQAAPAVPALPVTAEEAPAAVTGVAFKPHRILVADDNQDAAQTLADLLGMMGHEVRTAGDGVEAIRVAEAFRPDIIFLDIGMPRMDGYEACRGIRALAQTPAPQIIALTGWGQADDKRKAQEAGFDHHFTKPVDSGRLEAMVGSNF
jgi:PAS domain S-box-containing protein